MMTNQQVFEAEVQALNTTLPFTYDLTKSSHGTYRCQYTAALWVMFNKGAAHTCDKLLAKMPRCKC